MSENEQTSEAVGTIAARLLRDPDTPEDVKKIAASALTQQPGITVNEKTSPHIGAIAARLLGDPATPEDIKTVAGSVLTQCPDKRVTFD